MKKTEKTDVTLRVFPYNKKVYNNSISRRFGCLISNYAQHEQESPENLSAVTFDPEMKSMNRQMLVKYFENLSLPCLLCTKKFFPENVFIVNQCIFLFKPVFDAIKQVFTIQEVKIENTLHEFYEYVLNGSALKFISKSIPIYLFNNISYSFSSEIDLLLNEAELLLFAQKNPNAIVKNIHLVSTWEVDDEKEHTAYDCFKFIIPNKLSTCSFSFASLLLDFENEDDDPEICACLLFLMEQLKISGERDERLLTDGLCYAIAKFASLNKNPESKLVINTASLEVTQRKLLKSYLFCGSYKRMPPEINKFFLKLEISLD
eukprot:snap_masked-scaffold_22-processed-gene-1.11-mRNA-1 protein AED:1.00 eAED:1.00 QI:0/0/0/0/1/1/2/0/317